MAQTSLPSITRTNDIQKFLKVWQARLAPILKVVSTPKAPWNFKATSSRGGIQLTWTPLPTGADGYQILRSSSGNFSNPESVINLPGITQAAYFDPLPSSISQPSVTKFYKLRATNGTTQNPQSVQGLLTGIVSNTSIATTDNVTTPTTVKDTTITDRSQAAARLGQRLVYSKLNVT